MLSFRDRQASGPPVNTNMQRNGDVTPSSWDERSELADQLLHCHNSTISLRVFTTAKAISWRTQTKERNQFVIKPASSAVYNKYNAEMLRYFRWSFSNRAAHQPDLFFSGANCECRLRGSIKWFSPWVCIRLPI